MNLASITGFFLCFVIILSGVATNGGLSTLGTFIHFPSMLVTFGGAFLAVLAACDSFRDYFDGLKSFPEALKKKEEQVLDIPEQIFEMSNLARKEGLLALEEKSSEIKDEFMKKGIMLVVDGTDPELVKDIMETEMIHKSERNRVKISFWEDLGAFAPAWGMVGTLIGLINMMRSIGGDTASIGAGMSLALITTLYGSVLANWVCAPIVRKMKKNDENEMLSMELTIEGILSIQAGENPRVINEKMKAFFVGGTIYDKVEENGEN
ncbi:MAG: motility protein A [Lachnospiraceae bacterium]|nr:motility protein A [Lachnospiraceae bacterium]